MLIAKCYQISNWNSKVNWLMIRLELVLRITKIRPVVVWGLKSEPTESLVHLCFHYRHKFESIISSCFYHISILPFLPHLYLHIYTSIFFHDSHRLDGIGFNSWLTSIRWYWMVLDSCTIFVHYIIRPSFPNIYAFYFFKLILSPS